jgi:hypothetical protein
MSKQEQNGRSANSNRKLKGGHIDLKIFEDIDPNKISSAIAYK